MRPPRSRHGSCEASRLMHRAGFVLVLALLRCSPVLGEEAPALNLAALPTPDALAELLWNRSPDLSQVRTRLGAAQADVRRSLVLPNPNLDLSWNTIPVGTSNPAGLDDPLTHVPNYAVSLSSLVEIAKRGPRQRAARNGFTAVELDASELLREHYFDLLDRIAEVAAAEVRVGALSDLAADAARLKDIQGERAKRGDAAGLDVDRARLEEEKFVANLADERRKLAQALLECSRLVGVPCEPFADRDRAAGFLSERQAIPAATGDVDERPDLRALSAQAESARASLELAHNKRIPDPTLRAGYVYDQFVAAGNQRNSFLLGVSVPLPVFDRGQGDAIEAAANLQVANRTRALLRAQATRDASQLASQSADVEKQRGVLRDRSIPLARSLVRTLDSAVQRGGSSLQDLLLARRTLGELLLDSADLDLQAFQISSASARNAAAGPPLPRALGSSS